MPWRRSRRRSAVADRRPGPGPRWLLLGIVLVVALFVGSGVLDRHVPTSAERISSLEASVKCPSCQDLSVAQSTSPSSLAVRSQIVAGVRRGQSDEQIVAGLRARYGTEVELTPTGGLSAILWIVPVLLLVAVVLAVIVGARRRRAGP